MDPEPPPEIPAGLMTREQVAELLQVSARSVDRYTKAGDLKSFKFGRIVRYDLRDVLAFVEAHRQ